MHTAFNEFDFELGGDGGLAAAREPRKPEAGAAVVLDLFAIFSSNRTRMPG